MPNLHIRGTILPDNFWMEDNVCCLSDFMREMSQAGDTLDLYIDSPGGDVFASNTISVMLAEWCMAHPNAKCTCTIGGLCASAAANIVAKLPAQFTVSCFKDSLFMYHSAYGMVMGGPDALRDNAVLMDLVNGVVIQRLLAKTTLDETRIRTAFQEGREMWLDGDEAVSCGLVNGLKDGNADATVKDLVYDDDTSTDAYRYAACVTKNIHNKLEARLMAEDDNKPEVDETEATTAAEVTAEAIPQAECGDDDNKPEACDDTPKAECGGEDDKDDTKAELDALKAENDALKAEIESLKALVAKYQPTAKATAAQAVKQDWMTMVRELNAKHLPEQAYAKEYIALKAAHKAEFDEFMAKHSTRVF